MKSKKNNKIYAIKKLPTEMKLKEKINFRRETEIMINLIHDNVIRFYGYFKDKEKKDKYKEICEEINKKKIKKLIWIISKKIKKYFVL
jgi:serine/threonine protein kinase